MSFTSILRNRIRQLMPWGGAAGWHQLKEAFLDLDGAERLLVTKCPQLYKEILNLDGASWDDTIQNCHISTWMEQKSFWGGVNAIYLALGKVSTIYQEEITEQ